MKAARLLWNEQLGLSLPKKNENSVVTMSHLGQRREMLHHLANVLGSFLDSGEPDLIPFSKRNKEDGRVALFFLPREKDFKQIKEVLKHVPILDSAIPLSRQPDKGKGKG